MGEEMMNKIKRKMMHERNMARFLRVAVIRNVLGQGLMTRDDALELLRGPLTPGDDSTVVDDTNLLDMTVDEVQVALDLQLPSSAGSADEGKG